MNHGRSLRAGADARTGAAALMFALVASAVPRSVRAEEARPKLTSALSWVRLPGTEACLSASDLSERVEKRLGRPVFVTPSAADVSIEGRAEPRTAGNKKGFRMVVRGVRRDGTEIGARELDSERPDCHALDDTLTLVVALMIDPDADVAAKPAPPPEPPPPPVVAPPPRDIVHERVIVHEVAAPPPRGRLDAYVAGTVGFGRLPGAAPGLALVVRLGPRAVPFEASLGAMPAAEVRNGDRTATYSLLEGGLAACPAMALGTRVELGGCAGARVGNVHTRGSGFHADAEVDRPLVDAVVGPRLQVTLLEPVFLIVSTSAVVPFVRQRTTYTAADGSTQSLHERAALGAEVGIGLGVRFLP